MPVSASRQSVMYSALAGIRSEIERVPSLLLSFDARSPMAYTCIFAFPQIREAKPADFYPIHRRASPGCLPGRGRVLTRLPGGEPDRDRQPPPEKRGTRTRKAKTPASAQ